MTLLLTGASGFVGQHLSRFADCRRLESPGGAFVDIREFDLLKLVLVRLQPRRVIHLAAVSDVRYAAEHPKESFDVNTLGTFNLLRALGESGFRGRLLCVSSGAVYGAVPERCLPIAESQPVQPSDAYAASKLAAEAWCHWAARSWPFDVILARPFNHVGPGQARHFALADFTAQMVEMRLGRREPVLSTGNLDVSRDFTDVRDVARAYLMLLERGANGEVYNVCSGRERTLRSVIDHLARVAGVLCQVRTDPDRRRAQDHSRVVGDPGKLRETVGWEPEIPWQQTLADLVHHWEAELNG